MTGEDEQKKGPYDIPEAMLKNAIKEAAREWLDEIFQTFGKYSIFGLMGAALVGAVYLALAGAGWHR